MAIRADASGDYYQRTASLPAYNAFTISLWFQQRTDLGAVFQSLATLTDSTIDGSFLQIDGSQGLIIGDFGGASSSILTVSLNGWYFAAMTCAGSGAGQLIGYGAAFGSAALSTQSFTGPASFTPSSLTLFDDTFSEPFDGEIAAVKVWDRVLTQAELEIERWYYLPVLTNSLHGYWPMWGTSDGATDFSGNGKSWTVNGTVASADGPPLPWSPPRDDESAYVIAAATGQPYAKRLAGVPFMGGGSGLPWRVRQW